jgi:outer membrane protein
MVFLPDTFFVQFAYEDKTCIANFLEAPTMNLKSSSLFLVFMLVCGLSRGQAQEKITLEQAINLALTNNIQLKQAKLNVALTAEEYKQSKWALTPSLNANSNLNYSLGRSFDQLSGQAFDQSVTSGNGSLSSSVVLFQGFQRINQISQNKYLLAADKINAEKAKNDLILNVVSTYLQVLNAQDLVETATQQVTFSSMQLDREQKLFDVGNKTLADLSQAKAQFATADLNLTNAGDVITIKDAFLSKLLIIPSQIIFKASMSNPESISSKITNFGSNRSICKISLRFFSPPEKPSFKFRFKNSFFICNFFK